MFLPEKLLANSAKRHILSKNPQSYIFFFNSANIYLIFFYFFLHFALYCFPNNKNSTILSVFCLKCSSFHALMHLNNNKHVNRGVKIFAKEVMNDKDSGHALQSVYAKNKTIGRCAAVFRRKICVFKFKFVPLLAFCAAYRLTTYRFSGAHKAEIND